MPLRIKKTLTYIHIRGVQEKKCPLELRRKTLTSNLEGAFKKAP
jgi:hypothetical protein